MPDLCDMFPINYKPGQGQVRKCFTVVDHNSLNQFSLLQPFKSTLSSNLLSSHLPVLHHWSNQSECEFQIHWNPTGLKISLPNGTVAAVQRDSILQSM